MLRLVAYAPDGVLRFPLVHSQAVIGSEPECEICLPYTGVARRHARLAWDGRELAIQDLGSRRGVLVNGQRVKQARLQPLDEVRLGAITLLVDDAGAPAGETPAPQPAPAEPAITAERFVAYVAALSDWVLGDAESRATAESLVHRVLEAFGGGALFLLQVEEDRAPGVRLVVATRPEWLATGQELMPQIEARRQSPGAKREAGAFEGPLGEAPAWISFRYFIGLERPHLLVTALPAFRPAGWSPEAGLWAVGDLLVLGLVHHVGRYEPLLPGHGAQQELRLAPGLIVGESAAMRGLLEALRGAVEPAVHVLLRGEPGCGQEVLARSLHLSGPRRHAPFLAASCAGAAEAQLEADLFGAQVRGKGEILERTGKLALAHGGTLFLDDVDQLPLGLQSKLLRFLRSGEVEPAGGVGSTPADVRVVAASREALEPLVARGLFRVDLVYRLSGFAFDVPALRQRREDLPLLIQSYLNRFCHEAGKRVHGITVTTLAALAAHDYPGNLTELEALVRQLVYLCPAGEPIRESLLPERLRRARLHAAARVDAATGDLRLERLVAAAEQAAIREALRRSSGNKARAAKLLGISRNGLAMKMERHGLKG